VCVIFVLALLNTVAFAAAEAPATTSAPWVPPQPQRKCPCSNASLCLPIQGPFPEKQIWAWEQNPTNFLSYDYARVTTFSLGGGFHSDLLCYARFWGIRVVWRIIGPPDFAQIVNATYRTEYVQNVLQYAVDHYVDGIDIDIEDNVLHNQTDLRDGLTAFTKELAWKMRRTIVGGGQLSFCVANQPLHNGGRYYDYAALAETVDYLLIMDYCTWSMAPGSTSNITCLAGPNAPASTALVGIAQYLAVYNQPSKYILAVPWFGYLYQCAAGTQPDAADCPIPNTPWNGLFYCSDGVAAQWNYWTIMDMSRGNFSGYFPTTPVTVNTTASGLGSWARVNAVAADGKGGWSVYQAWFDTPETLKQKYIMAKANGLGGVGFWNVDAISCGAPLTTENLIDQANMWRALDTFLR
jgi:di-N-acetylchitobiase